MLPGTQPRSPLPPHRLLGWHLVVPLSLSLSFCLKPLSSLTSSTPPPTPPAPLPLSPLFWPVWVTPGPVSLSFSLMLGRLFPADEGFAWQHSAARHEHNKKWRTTCQSPCQCRHEMKSEREERQEADSSEGEIKKNSQWGPGRSSEASVAGSCADWSQTGVFFYLPPPTSLCTFLPCLIFLMPVCEELIRCGLFLLHQPRSCVHERRCLSQVTFSNRQK